jgi:predicted ATP-grasp superfamily ATP-dependent carboligase
MGSAVSSDNCTNEDAPVVILNMHYTGLAIARGLQTCGVSAIYGLSANDAMIGNHSRFCRHVRCPDTESEAESCRDFLLAFSEQFGTRPLLFPTRDHDLQLIRRFHDELSNRYRIVAAPPPLLQHILNKAALYDTAREVGIPCPATVWIDSQADVRKVKETLAFPVIVKPVYTTQWRKQAVWPLVGGQKAAMIEDYEALLRFYGRVERVDPVMHAQEFIPGADTELVVFGSYANPDAGLLRYFTGRKLLQYPSRSGTGVAVQACPVPEIVEPSRRLLARLGYRGPSEIEYKHDRRTGKHVLIEMNPRFWDQHGLGAAVGVNLAECAFRDMTGVPAPEQCQAEDRVTWIAEEGYVLALVSNLRSRQYEMSEFAGALRGRLALAVFRGDDARPAVAMAARTVRELASGAVTRVARALRHRGGRNDLDAAAHVAGTERNE